ncbi:MAG: tetratricopeptide repeat protein [bacterium]
MSRHPDPQTRARRRPFGAERGGPVRRGLPPALVFALVSAAGFLVRLAWLLQARGVDPLFFAPQMDALYHHRWALAIAAGAEFAPGAFFRAPLYPHFLALIYRLLGPDLVVVRLVQAVLGGLSCGLTWLLARRVFAPPAARRKPGSVSTVPGGAALAAALAWAFWPTAIWFDGELLIPALLVPLLLLALVLTYRSIDTDRHWWLPGLVLGAAALARPNVLAFSAVLAGWLVVKYRRGALRRAGPLAAAVALAILPVAVRNARAGDPVLIAWQGGTNFYIGNNPESDGTTAIVPGTRPDWWGGYNDVKRIAEAAAGRGLRGSEIDRFWLRQGLGFWRDRPLAALGLTGRKLLLLASGYEVANNRDIYAAKRRTFINPVLFSTPWLKFPFGLLLPLALAGAWLLRRRAARLAPLYLFIAAYGLSFVPFFVTARYRLPLVPALLVVAAAGAAALVRARGREFGVAVAFLGAGLVLGNADLAGTGRPTETYHELLAEAVGRFESGRFDEASAVIDRALAADSTPELLALRVSVELACGRPAQAETAARALLRLEPDGPAALGSLGNVLAQTGRHAEAESLFRRAVEIDPAAVEAWLNLGNLALAARRTDEARACYERALAVSPAWAPALFHLGLAEYYSGRIDAARECWQQVLRLDPGHAGARRALSELVR